MSEQFDPSPKPTAIDGLTISARRQFRDERGKVMKMLSATDEAFRAFGEIYFSGVYEGVIKGWNLHSTMWLNYACVVGRVHVVFYDPREESSTRGAVLELHLSPDADEEYALVTVPPGVCASFQGLAPGISLIANCASIPHDPAEYRKIDLYDNDIPYRWPRAES